MVKTDQERLRSLIPLNSLTLENFQHLCKEISVEELPPGVRLFSIGDEDTASIFLVSGEIDLHSSDGTKTLIHPTKEMARYALSNLKPRRYTGVTRTLSRIARVDSRLVDKLMVVDTVIQDTMSGFVVEEFDIEVGDKEWIIKLLQKKLFINLPGAHVQKVLGCMHEVIGRAGDVIVRQGDSGDYYYVICHGTCQVTRKMSDSVQPVVLAELSIGDTLGEEALISKSRRNATVTMKTDGILMKLSSQDFAELLEQPVLRWMSPREAAQSAKEGAILLDVRTVQEYTNSKIRGSRNIPLQYLRDGAGRLEQGKRYICYCDTGERSSAAAFLLQERGIDASVMRGGLSYLMDLFRAKSR